MSHKEQMQIAISNALDAMPQRMRPCDMAGLFSHFIINYNMEPNTAEIVLATAKMVQIYVDEWSDEEHETKAAITDADQFLAKIQAGKQT